MSASTNRRSKKILPKSLAAEPDLRHAMDAIPQLVWSAFPDSSVEAARRRSHRPPVVTGWQDKRRPFFPVNRPELLDGRRGFLLAGT
jgi:hypothetical protein